jgi:hypothetical protein
VHAVKRVALLVVPALALVGITVGVAQAAVSGTVNPATVSGSDFSWTCDVNPDGTTIYVAGRSWYNPNRPDAPAVDTPRKQISGSSTQRLTFSRDGEPNTSYGYRCVWFGSATSTTLLGRTDTSLTVTTKSDTMFGANVDGSTRLPCAAGTSGCTCDQVTHACTRKETFQEALTREDAAYAPKFMRLYWQDLPSTNCAEERNVLSRQRPSLQSFKGDPGQLSAGAYNSTLNAWLSCFNQPTRVTFYHEPENDFTTAAQKTAYRASWDAFINLVQAHPNHANLIPTLILMDYDLVSSAGRNWRDWYNPRVSELWWDTYGFNDRDTDHTNNDKMAAHQTKRASLAVNRAEGKPYGIGEIGYNDPTDRPAFLSDLAAWARSNHIVGVAYFDSNGTTGDHRLKDSASQTAWRTACA